MHVPQSLLAMPPSSVQVRFVLYLKNDVAHGHFKEYSVSGPTIGAMQMQTYAIMI